MPTIKNKKDQQQENNNNSGKAVDTNRKDKNNNKPTAVNENPSTISKLQQSNRELHTKHGVLGSDSDGQAD